MILKNSGVVDVDKHNVLTNRIIKLEKQLIAKKQAADKLANLIADDFQEIDFNGTVREKYEVMQWLNRKSSSIRVGLNIKAKVLSDTVILISYLCSTKPNPSAAASLGFRSSIWQEQEGRWRMVFHQKIPINQ